MAQNMKRLLDRNLKPAPKAKSVASEKGASISMNMMVLIKGFATSQVFEQRMLDQQCLAAA